MPRAFVYSGVHDSAKRPLSRWAARDAYNPRRYSRMSTAEPAAKPWTDSNVFTPLIESLMRAYYWPIGPAVRPYIYLMR
jgi:hypothetical protein